MNSMYCVDLSLYLFICIVYKENKYIFMYGYRFDFALFSNQWLCRMRGFRVLFDSLIGYCRKMHVDTEQCAAYVLIFFPILLELSLHIIIPTDSNSHAIAELSGVNFLSSVGIGWCCGYLYHSKYNTIYKAYLHSSTVINLKFIFLFMHSFTI